MLLDFWKMNGAGNDFVLLDNRAGSIQLTPEQVVRICDRHRGVGADGLLLLEPSKTAKADWAWQFYNSDGSTAEMCGNGARCFARFVEKVSGRSGAMSFETGAGIVHARIDGGRVTIGLTAPHGMKLEEKIELKEGTRKVHSINTGVPHAVLFVPDADQAMVQPTGAEVRYHPHFAPKGTNVNFVQVLRPGAIRVRTYERGVEGETLACGTGVTAAALITAAVHRFSSPIEVLVQGGDRLSVQFDADGSEFTNVELNGPADFVFEGRIEV